MQKHILKAIEALPTPEVRTVSVEADYQCFRYLVAVDEAQWDFDESERKLFWRTLKRMHESKLKTQKTKQRLLTKVDFETWKARVLEAREMTEEQLWETVKRRMFHLLGEQYVSPEQACDYFMSMEYVFNRGREREEALRKEFWKWLDLFRRVLSVDVNNARRRLDVDQISSSETEFVNTIRDLERINQISPRSKAPPAPKPPKLHTVGATGKPTRYCSVCKRNNHNEEQCWIAHPHLRPTQQKRNKEVKEAGARLKSEDSEYYVLFDSGNLEVSLCTTAVAEGRQQTETKLLTLRDYRGRISTTSKTVQIPLAWQGKQLGNITCYVVPGCIYDIILAKEDMKKMKIRLDLENEYAWTPEIKQIPFEKSPAKKKAINVVREDTKTTANSWKSREELFELMPDIKAWEEKDITMAQRLKELIWEFRECFQQDLNPAGAARFPPVHLELKKGAVPVRSYPYPTSPEQKEQEWSYLQKMLEAQVIERKRSTWASPFLLVKKANTDQLRPVVNFTKLNDNLKYEIYAIPRVTDVFQELAGSKWFSVLDVTSGFWNLPLDESSKELCGISTHFGSYVYRALPMGLHLSTSIFEEAMEETLGDLNDHRVLQQVEIEHVPTNKSRLLGNSCRNLVDDVTIYSAGTSEALQHLREVLERFRLFNWKAKPTKAKLLRQETTLLGHVVSDKGVKTDPEKVKALLQRPEPTNREEIRSVTQAFGWYRAFIENFAELVGPMTELTKKNVKWCWSKEHSELYQKLKKAMANAPVLSYPNWNKPFEIVADASGWAIGGLVGQRDESGMLKPISYISRWLSPVKRRWGATDRELEAMREVAKANKQFLKKGKTVAWTDHEPATRLIAAGPREDQSNRRQSILTELQEFDLVPRYLKGTHPEMKVADMLSRIPGGAQQVSDQRKNREPTEKTVVPLTSPQDIAQEALVNVERKISKNLVVATTKTQVEETKNWVAEDMKTLNLKEEQNKDKFLLALKHRHLSGTWPENMDNKMKKAILEEEGSTIYWKDLLYRMPYRRNIASKEKATSAKLRSTWQLWLPESMILKVVRAYHEEELGGGHLGTSKTLQKIRSKYYARGLNKCVLEFCSNCKTCAEHNTYRHTMAAPLQPLPQATRLNQRIAMDIMGPFPLSSRGNRWILAVQDYLTKWIVLCPLVNTLTETVADAFVDNWICWFSCPEEILTDRGANFLSQVMIEVNLILAAKKLTTTPYNPRCDGMVERSNSTTATMLAKFTTENQEDWDKKLKLVQFDFNSMPSEAYKVAPYEMLLGVEPRLPIDMELGQGNQEQNKIQPQTDYVKTLKKNLKEVREFATTNAEISQGKMKVRYDSKVRFPNFAVGDLVMVVSTKHTEGMAKKLETKFVGPLKITEILNGGANLRLARADGTEWSSLVNVSRVKPFFGMLEEKALPPLRLEKVDEEDAIKDAANLEDTKEAQEMMVERWKKEEKAKEALANMKIRKEVSKEEREKKKKEEKQRRKQQKKKEKQEASARDLARARIELKEITTKIQTANEGNVSELKEKCVLWIERAGKLLGGPKKLEEWKTKLSKQG